MQTHNSAFERLLTAEIEAQIEELKEEIAAGNAVDHANYRFLAGRIAGLRMAMNHFEDVNKKLDER